MPGFLTRSDGKTASDPEAGGHAKPESPRLHIRTLLRYLIGDRQAILEIASNPRALGLGLVFVFSAALAREYDGEDLLRKPWVLLLPLGASLVASFVVFTLAFVPLAWKGAPRPSFISAYGSFLGLFWMTAPLAWLYGVPYERFLPAVTAVRANLWTLELVAVWRVVLIVRVLQVLMGYRLIDAIFVVMIFVDSVALTVLHFLPFPIINFMGGIPLSERDEVLNKAAMSLCMWGLCSFPLWLVGFPIALVFSRPAWQAPLLARANAPVPAWGLRLLAWYSLAVWGLFLPFTQPEQQLRVRVEQAFREERTETALAEMSAHSRSDFPPHWEPPLGMDPSVQAAQLLERWEKLLDSDQAPWVRELFLEKLRTILMAGYFYGPGAKDLPKFGRLLSRLPEGPAIVEELSRREQTQIVDSLRPYLSWDKGNTDKKTGS